MSQTSLKLYRGTCQTLDAILGREVHDTLLWKAGELAYMYTNKMVASKQAKALGDKLLKVCTFITCILYPYTEYGLILSLTVLGCASLYKHNVVNDCIN